MSFRKYFPASAWIIRAVTGRIARRIYLATILLLIVVSASVRICGYVLTRRMHTIIAELSKLEIDKTDESELVRRMPYLKRSQYEVHTGGESVEYGKLEEGVEHWYGVDFSNSSGWERFERFAECFSDEAITKDGRLKSWIYEAADVLGYRYVGFFGTVITFNGKVSRIYYGIEDRDIRPSDVAGDLVSVKSFHTRYASHHMNVRLSSFFDENPDFEIQGYEDSVRVSFTADAAPELKAHAFQIKLRCFWALAGCRRAEQVAPALWRDKIAIEAATISRLEGPDPCPERIIAGRMKLLPDMAVALLEVTGPGNESARSTQVNDSKAFSNFKLIEQLRGPWSKLWDRFGIGETIPYPGNYQRQLPNPELRWARAGQRVIAFEGSVSSCRILPATPSALAAVRNGRSAPRRTEDMQQTIM